MVREHMHKKIMWSFLIFGIGLGLITLVVIIEVVNRYDTFNLLQKYLSYALVWIFGALSTLCFTICGLFGLAIRQKNFEIKEKSYYEY